MNAVLYYSNAGESKRVAEYFADNTGYAIYDLTMTSERLFQNVVTVFPVYCQNVQKAVDKFLSELKADNVILIAVYGKMSYGNVLYEMQNKHGLNIIGGAYVPAKHAYLNEPRFDGFEKLKSLLDKLQSPTAVKIPKSRKNPFANFAPAWRSRKGVKITLDGNKCNDCKTCEKVCLEHAINNGKPNSKCIRCMRCVNACPQGALNFKLSYAMRRYLRKPRANDTIIYK